MALGLIPNPGIRSEKILERELALQDEVLTEVRQRLKLHDDEEFEKSKGRVYEFLAGEMVEIAFLTVDEDVVKQRVGQKGLLRSDLYEIHFTQFYEENFPQFGIRKAHVRETVHNPDEVEHLLRQKDGEFDAISIFLKAIPRSEPQSLLVIAKRKGFEQHISWALKVYHSDVDLSTAHTPVDVWKAFANSYGLEMKVGATKGKFILYERIPAEGNKEIELVTGKLPESKNFINSLVFRKNANPPSFDVALAFSLDVEKYKADLRKHGVPVTD